MSKNIKLLNFFIFNPILGQHEGEEHKKLLYYYPEDCSLNSKIKHIGLAEAIIRFSSVFTNSTCENLHTLKTRQLFYEGEKNYWFVMTVNIPFYEKNTNNIVYLDDNVNDLLYRSILINLYKMFKLLNGDIRQIVTSMELEGLKLRFTQFFNKQLATLNFIDADINSVFQGLQFLPLDRTSYLKIQSFVNHLEETIPQITHCVVIHNRQLVWSGIEQEDIRILYNYLITNLLNNTNSLSNSIQALNFKQSRIGCFLYGPTDLQDESNIGIVPHIYLSMLQNQDSHLAIYHVFDCTLCVLIDGSFHLHFEFFRKLDSFLQTNFDVLAVYLKDILNKRQIPNYIESAYKYIYFNHVNLAHKSTIYNHQDSTASESIIQLCSYLYQNLNWIYSEYDEEMVVKSGDSWVYMKKCDERDVIVLINNKHANLSEVEDEMRKICSTQFNNIFYPEQ